MEDIASLACSIEAHDTQHFSRKSEPVKLGDRGFCVREKLTHCQIKMMQHAYNINPITDCLLHIFNVDVCVN